jgi:hypothetical protein
LAATAEAAVSGANINPRSPDSYIQHVYPIEAREHVTSGTGGASGGCWCGPDLYRLCTACYSDDPGCWACGGEGIVRIEAIVPGDRVIVVHRYVPDDATSAMG